MFGCMCQSEPGTHNKSRSLYAVYGTEAQPPTGQGGKVEIFGSRVTDFEGNVFGGGGTVGISTYNATHDGRVLSKYDSGLILCDASAGSFRLLLPGVAISAGESYSFKKIDASSNTVTIGVESDGLIDGATDRMLNAQYERARIVAGYDTYYLV